MSATEAFARQLKARIVPRHRPEPLPAPAVKTDELMQLVEEAVKKALGGRGAEERRPRAVRRRAPDPPADLRRAP